MREESGVKSQELGVTLLEILVTLGILFVLATIGVGAVSNFRKHSLLDEARARVLAESNFARSQTLGSEENSAWGVHFEASRIVRFKGEVFLSADPSNREVLLPSGTKISSISLLGGSSDVVFERLTGRVANFGTITIELTSDSSQQVVITVHASGGTE